MKNQLTISRTLADWPMGLLYATIQTQLIKAFGDILPTQGIIAGQAVSSACMTMLGLGEGKMNDLDVFVAAEMSDSTEKSTSTTDTLFYRNPPSRNDMTVPGIRVSDCSFNDGLFFETLEKFGYSLIYSGRDPVNPAINIVGCKTYHDELTPELVLGSFDINVCQIALDVENRRVVWTPEFQAMLHDQKLRITCLSTPVHSVFRLIKKAQEMPFLTLDLASELSLLQRARIIGKRCEPSDKGYLPSQLLSDASFEKYRQFEPLIAPYFSVRRVMIPVPLFEEDLRDIDNIPGNLSLSLPECASQDTREYLIRASSDMLLYDALCAKDLRDGQAVKAWATTPFYTLDPVNVDNSMAQDVSAVYEAYEEIRRINEDSRTYLRLSEILFTTLRGTSDVKSCQAQLHALQSYLDKTYGMASDEEHVPSDLPNYVENLHRQFVPVMCYLLRHSGGSLLTVTPADLDRIYQLCIKSPALVNNVLYKVKTADILSTLVSSAANFDYLVKTDRDFVANLYVSRTEDLDAFNFPSMTDPNFIERLVIAQAAFEADAKKDVFIPLLEATGALTTIKACLPRGCQIAEPQNKWDFWNVAWLQHMNVGRFYYSSKSYKYAPVYIHLEKAENTTCDAMLVYYINWSLREDLTVLPDRLSWDDVVLTLKRQYIHRDQNVIIPEAVDNAFPDQVPVNRSALSEDLDALLWQAAEEWYAENRSWLRLKSKSSQEEPVEFLDDIPF